LVHFDLAESFFKLGFLPFSSELTPTCDRSARVPVADWQP
jgi:hypothetical protein